MWDDSWKPLEHVDMTDLPFVDTEEWNLNAPESPKSYMTLETMNEINDRYDELDIRILKYEKIEITNNTAKQIATLQEGIDRELAKNISALIKKSKLKVQSSVQGDSIRVTGKKRDDLQDTIQFIKEQKYSIPLQFDNFRD